MCTHMCVERSSVNTQAKTRGLAVFFPPFSLSRVTFQFHISGGGELNPPEALFSFYLSGNDPDDFSPSIHPSPLILTYLRGLVNPACIVEQRADKT